MNEDRLGAILARVVSACGRLSAEVFRRDSTGRGAGPFIRLGRRAAERAAFPIEIVRDGIRFSIEDPRNNAEEALLWGRPYDPFVMNSLRRVVRAGDTVADIGANVGYFTCHLAELVGASGRVLAFEPSEHHRRSLRINLALQRRFNVLVFATALGARPERRKHFTTASSGSLVAAFPSSVGDRPVEQWVDVRTLDELLATEGLPPPRVIKLDVDGNESEILTGARHLLEVTRPHLVIEVAVKTLSRAAVTPEALLLPLDALDYRFRVDGRSDQLRLGELTRFAPWSASGSCDVLCSPVGSET